MVKNELVNIISEDTGMTKTEVLSVIDDMLKHINSELLSGGKVIFRGLGTFYSELRKERTARDIRKGKTIIIPERYVVRFKPSIALADGLAKKDTNGKC